MLLSILSGFPEAPEFLSGKDRLRLFTRMDNSQYIISSKKYKENSLLQDYRTTLRESLTLNFIICVYLKVTEKTAQHNLDLQMQIRWPPSLYAMHLRKDLKGSFGTLVLNRISTNNFWLPPVQPLGAFFSSDSFLFQFMGATARAVFASLMKYVLKQCLLELRRGGVPLKT